MAAGRVIRSFAVPGGNFPFGLTWDGKYLWLANAITTDTIHQIDPVTGRSIKSFAAPAGQPGGLTWDGRTLWNTCFGTDRIYQLDPVTGETIKSFPGLSSMYDLAWDGRCLWTIQSTFPRIIAQFDPMTGTQIKSFAAPNNTPSGLTFDGRTLWHTNYNTDLIYQLSVN